MKHFVALFFIFVALVAIVAPARAALVYDGTYYPTTGPGGFSTPYPADTPQVYAGLLETNISGTSTLMMSDDYNTRVNLGEFWTTTLYTFDDVKNGAPVKFTAAQYARAGYILHNYFPMDVIPNSMIQGLATTWGNDTLALANTQVRDLMSSTSCPPTMSFCSAYDNFNWSWLMLVASGRDEYLIPINVAKSGIPNMGTMSITPSVPVPPAVWLFGSGLIALVGISRRKK